MVVVETTIHAFMDQPDQLAIHALESAWIMRASTTVFVEDVTGEVPPENPGDSQLMTDRSICRATRSLGQASAGQLMKSQMPQRADTGWSDLDETGTDPHATH